MGLKEYIYIQWWGSAIFQWHLEQLLREYDFFRGNLEGSKNVQNLKGSEIIYKKMHYGVWLKTGIRGNFLAKHFSEFLNGAKVFMTRNKTKYNPWENWPRRKIDQPLKWREETMYTTSQLTFPKKSQKSSRIEER